MLRSTTVTGWDTRPASRPEWRVVPAVRNKRVHFVFDDRIVIPGPRVVAGTEALARTLHPAAFAGNLAVGMER